MHSYNHGNCRAGPGEPEWYFGVLVENATAQTRPGWGYGACAVALFSDPEVKRFFLLHALLRN